MGINYNPAIVKDGLIFYYDTNNTQKSWKGAPTTNLISNPFGPSSPSPMSFSYEGTAAMVPALNSSMNLISPYWIQFTKNLGTNGRMIALALTGLTPGVDYSLSYYVYVKESAITQVRWQTDSVLSSTDVSYPLTWTTSDIGSIKRLCTIFRSVSGSQTQVLRIGSNDPIGSIIYVAAIQCEQQSFATPIVNGSRSNTQAILDLTNNTTITATSATYSSNNTFSFNGTSDGIMTSALPSMPVDNFAIETVIYPTAYPATSTMFLVPSCAGLDQCISMESNGILNFQLTTNADVGNRAFSTPSAITLNTYTHIVCTKNGPNIGIYKNGILVTSSAADTLASYGWGGVTLNIGQRGNNTFYFTGKIPIVRVYNHALTSSEVFQNFNALRGRYGL